MEILFPLHMGLDNPGSSCRVRQKLLWHCKRETLGVMGTPCAKHHASYPGSPQAQLASAPLAASPPVGPACHVALCNPSGDMMVPGAGWQAVGRACRSTGADRGCLGLSPAGIACIALTFVDEHGSPTSLPHGERPDPLKLPSSSPIVGLLQDADFESLTAVSRHQPETSTPHSGRVKQATSYQFLAVSTSPGAPRREGWQRWVCRAMQDCPFPAEPCMLVRLDIWEKGNISLLQLSEKLRGALRHALCDAVMEFLVLPAPLCVEATSPLGAADLEELSSAGESLTRMPIPNPQPALLLPLGLWELGSAGGTGAEGAGRKSLSPLQAVLCDVSRKNHYRNGGWKRYVKVYLLTKTEFTLLGVAEGSLPSLQLGSGQPQWGTRGHQQCCSGKLWRV